MTSAEARKAGPSPHAPPSDPLRVLVLAPYPMGTAPSQRYRFEQYIEPLEDRGIRLEVHSLLDPATWRILYAPGHHGAKVGAVLRGALARLRDVLQASRYDAALVHKESFPLGPAVFERALAARSVPYIFDFDDAVYRADPRAPNRLIAPLKFPQKTRSIVEHASVVAAGNEYLAGWAREHNPRVEIIPSTVDTALYRPRDDVRPGPVCIGWTGSKTTSPNLLPLAPVLRDLQRDHGARLRFIGDESFSIPGAHSEVLPWREASEVEDLQKVDIGLMPLPDTEWARGKCGMKALQYMGLGIPTVMSPVGVNVDIAAEGAALLATSPEEWRKVLVDLITDDEKRARIGAEGRRRVVERYSVAANVEAWASALRAASVHSRR